MITLPIRRIVGAAVVAGVGAAASWAVRRYLQGRRLHGGERAQHREMLHTWENEGGNVAPTGAYASDPAPQ
jgi:hypothetical protein